MDHFKPLLAALETAVAFLELQKQRGVLPNVHCKGGTGRSAAVALCWLVATRGTDAREAQLYLNEKRHVRKSLYLQLNVKAFVARFKYKRRRRKQECVDEDAGRRRRSIVLVAQILSLRRNFSSKVVACLHELSCGLDRGFTQKNASRHKARRRLEPSSRRISGTITTPSSV